MADFAELESQDGVRMPWNVIPGTKQESTDCVVPVSAVYTPLHPVPSLQLLPYSPLRCRTCRSVLNPFCVVDYDAKIWLCPICYQRNHFPPSYNAISLSSVPAELYPTCTTVEYDVSAAGAADHAAAVPPVFLFVVDTCVLEEELGFLKSALAQAFELLPEKSLVGLVTFGAYVQVHELGYGHVPKCYVFKGTKEVTKDQILEQMSFFTKSPKPPVGVIAGVRDGLSAESVSRFLLPASECEFVVNSVILASILFLSEKNLV